MVTVSITMERERPVVLAAATLFQRRLPDVAQILHQLPEHRLWSRRSHVTSQTRVHEMQVFEGLVGDRHPP